MDEVQREKVECASSPGHSLSFAPIRLGVGTGGSALGPVSRRLYAKRARRIVR